MQTINITQEMSLVTALQHNAGYAEYILNYSTGPCQLDDVIISAQQTLVGSVMQQCCGADTSAEKQTHAHSKQTNGQTGSRILHLIRAAQPPK